RGSSPRRSAERGGGSSFARLFPSQVRSVFPRSQPEVVPMRMRVSPRTVPSSRATRHRFQGVLAVALIAGCATLAAAQVPYVPYYGKNLIHYDKFEWHIYTTDHFEI